MTVLKLLDEAQLILQQAKERSNNFGYPLYITSDIEEVQRRISRLKQNVNQVLVRLNLTEAHAKEEKKEQV